MSYLPAFLDLRERPCVVVGGGEIAERKAVSLLGAGARVTVVAPEATPGLERLGREARLRIERRRYAGGDLEGAFLAVAATNDRTVQEAVAREAREGKVLLNVVDVPELCDFIAPAVLERGRLQVAVSTSGAAPGLAARVRDRVAALVGPEYETALEILAEARRLLHAGVRSAAERQDVMRELVAADLPDLLRRGDTEAVARVLERLGVGEALAASDRPHP